jgi:hypothetical protein
MGLEGIVLVTPRTAAQEAGAGPAEVAPEVGANQVGADRPGEGADQRVTIVLRSGYESDDPGAGYPPVPSLTRRNTVMEPRARPVAGAQADDSPLVPGAW